MKKVTRKIYVCNDGKAFWSEQETKAYEKKLSKQKIYAIFAEPDLCEGRYPAKLKGFLHIQGNDFKYENYSALAEWWCERKFGKHYDFPACVFSTWSPVECWKFIDVSNIKEFIRVYQGLGYTDASFKILDIIDKNGCKLLRKEE